jgi:hypothetical protein
MYSKVHVQCTAQDRVQYNTIQYKTKQKSAAQYSRVEYEMHVVSWEDEMRYECENVAAAVS